MKKLIKIILLLMLLIPSVVFGKQYFTDIVLTKTDAIWMDSRVYTSLSGAITAIGTDERILYIARNESFTGTIPANVKLQFFGEGGITATGAVTINTKDIIAHNDQIFYGTGNYDFAAGSRLKSAWFVDVDEAILETVDDEVSLIISKQETAATTQAIGNDVTLVFEAPGNELVLSGAFIVSNISQVVAGDFEIFTGTGRVDFNDGAIVKSTWFDQFRTAIRHIDDSEIELEIRKSETLDYDETVLIGTGLKFIFGNILTINTGRTLTVYSPGNIIASPTQYILTGAGDLDFTKSGTVYVEWWGQNTIHGTTNMTNAFIAAKDAIESSSGGVIKVPAGTFLLSATITFTKDNCYIEGSGKGNTIITRASDYGDTFEWNTGVAGFISDGGMSNLTITSTALTTSGAHIRIREGQRISFSDIYMLDGFIGFHGSGWVASEVQRVYIVFGDLYTGSATGRRYAQFDNESGIAHPSCGGLAFSDCNFRGGAIATSQVTEYGLFIRSGDGIWFVNTHIGTTTVANVFVQNSTAENTSGVMLDNCWLDACHGDNILIAGSTSSMFLIQFNDTIIKGGGYANQGISVDAGCVVDGLYINNCTISQHNKNGINIESTAAGKIIINSNHIYDNSYTVTDSFMGVNIDADVDDITIKNNMIEGRHAYGIKTNVGTSDDLVIINNDLRGNASGSFNNLSSGSNLRITDNRGYNPTGYSAQAVGASPYTYTNNSGWPEMIVINGGTVTGITVNGQGVTTTSGQFIIGPGQTIQVAYSSTPNFYRFGL